jgi:hypothetical protein
MNCGLRSGIRSIPLSGVDVQSCMIRSGIHSIPLSGDGERRGQRGGGGEGEVRGAAAREHERRAPKNAATPSADGRGERWVPPGCCCCSEEDGACRASVGGNNGGASKTRPVADATGDDRSDESM